ncbi:MAG: sensor histidine kinase, partial [Oscillospiraceae bacterium]
LARPSGPSRRPWKSSGSLEDAEHELKTPLAIISANNDVLELTTGKSPWSDSIRNQVSRMDGLLQSMLALTKLDAQRPTLQMEQLDFSSLVSQAAEPFCVLAETNQVSLSVQVEAEVCILGDAASLRNWSLILLENGQICWPQWHGCVQLEVQGKFTRLCGKYSAQSSPVEIRTAV